MRTFATIQEAIDSITDSSVAKHYLIKVMPGIYDLGSGFIQLKDFVDLKGSGPENTIITSSVTDTVNPGGFPLIATVIAGNNSSTSDLSINNSGGTGNSNVGLLFNNVIAKASNISITMRDAFTSKTHAIVIKGESSDVDLKNLAIKSIITRLNDNIGILVDGGYANISDSRVSLSGGEWVPGIATWNGATADVKNCMVESSNGRYVVALDSSVYGAGEINATESKIIAKNGSEDTYATWLNGLVNIQRSEIHASSTVGGIVAAVHENLNGAIGGSLIEGAVLSPYIKLVNCWDQNFAPILNR